jgi:hypothetical protein
MILLALSVMMTIKVSISGVSFINNSLAASPQSVFFADAIIMLLVLVTAAGHVIDRAAEGCWKIWQ